MNTLDPMLRQYVVEQVAWVARSPKADRYATLGLVYSANGLWTEAKLAFETARQLNPKEPLAWLYVAVSDQALGQLPDAVRLLRELTTQFPSFAPGFFRLGDYLLRLGQNDEAGAAFGRLNELAPREWRGFAGLADVKLRKGEVKEAVALLEQAVQIDPSAKSAHALLGQAYRRTDRKENAERELALGMNALQYPMPDAWSVHAAEHMRLLVDIIDIGQEYIQKAAPNRAVQALEKAVPFHPTNAILLVTLGRAYTLSGQPQKAQPVLQRALQVGTPSVPAYAALSECLLALGQADQALTSANRALLISTNRLEGYAAKANALLALGRDTEAVAALREAERCDPKNSQVLLDLGDICLRNLDDPDGALRAYHQAVTINPSLLEAHLRLVNLYMRLGNTLAATESLEAARRLAPDDSQIAEAQRNLGKPSSP
jgi:tetratricopeptide (TPR) repeat protein